MAGIMGPKRLMKFVKRILIGLSQSSASGVANSAEVHLEYMDGTYQVYRTVAAKSVRQEQTEHGPVKIIISENEFA
jgi:hypothetical protein